MQALTRFGPKAASATPHPDLTRAPFCARTRSSSPPSRTQRRYPRAYLGFNPNPPTGPPRTQFKLTCGAQFAVRAQIPFPARPNRARLKFKTEESQARLLIGTGPTQTQVRLRADPAHVKFRPSPDSTQETSDSTQIHLGFSSGSSQDP